MPAQDPGRRTISPDAARGGEIILRRPWQRSVFAGGLIAMVVLAVVLAVPGIWG